MSIDAYFQPIIATDTAQVFGHEALGRYAGGKSLGPFFLSRPSPGATQAERESMFEFKKRIDRTIRTDALRKAASAQGRIFINVTPSLMLGHLNTRGDELPYSIVAAREAGIDPKRIVLEITEENIEFEPESLLRLVARYREEGFLIALDDVGSAASNLDRIGIFEPDIIKIDFRLLERSAESHAFRLILDSLARLAERLGSDMLFEGIETEEHLLNALSYGASYLQGFLFAPARERFAEPGEFADTMDRYMRICYRRRLDLAIRNKRTERDLMDRISAMGLEQAFIFSAGTLDPVAFDAEKLKFLLDASGASESGLARIYATDTEGKQSTPNYILEGGGLRIDESARGRRWCCRPYFFDHIERSSIQPDQWTVSVPYRDIAYKVPVRTLGCTAAPNFIVFIDFLERRT